MNVQRRDSNGWTGNQGPRWGWVLLTFLIIGLALAAMPPHIISLRRETRGIVYGIPPAIPHTDVNPYAVNVDLVPLSDTALTHALDLLVNAGFGWVRLRFPWFAIERAPGIYDWTPWDRVVRALQQRGIRIIALVDGTPPWLRPPGEEDNPVVPPTDLEAFATFAGQLAQRYAGAIDYYQVWDQPNVSPFWGNERVDPAGYVAMLRRVGAAIKAADRTAYILSAGLAPTTLHEPYNYSDLDYLDAMYRAGARDAFDILGAKAYDLEGGDPWSRDYSPDRLGVARLVLLREIMVRHGDADKPVWLVGWGRHATPPGWTGRPSIWGTVSEPEQARYVYEVFRRKRQEWPWLGLLTWDQFYPQVPLDDPLWGFALLRPNWQPRPVYFAFQDLAAGAPLIGTGRYGPDSWVWQSPDPELRHTLVVEATHIGLVSSELVAVEASLDDQERSALVEPGREYVLGNRLPLKPHTLVLRLDPPGITTLIVARNRPLGPYLFLGLLILAAAISLARLVVWARSPAAEPIIVPGLVGVLIAFHLYSTVLPLNVVALGLLALLYIVWPHWGIVSTLLVLPLLPYAKPLGPWQFNVVEISLVFTVCAWGLRVALKCLLKALEPANVRWRYRLRLGWTALEQQIAPRSPLDGMALLLVAIGLWATLFARHQDVAWREFRWVVAEPVLFYWVLRGWWRETLTRSLAPVSTRLRTWLQRYTYRVRLQEDAETVGLLLASAVLWAGVLAVLLGVALFIAERGAVYAEGVYRLRGLYGSPNNMALFLGRGVSLGIALAVFWPSRVWLRHHHPFYVFRTRRGLVAVSVVLLLGLVLTFSRGALLLGLPATLAYLAWRAPRQWRKVLLLGLVALVLGLVPLWTTERFRSLFTGTGTLSLRIGLWTASLRMLWDHWFTGVGPDNFLYYFQSEYLPPRYPEPHLSHPHNVILHFWLALGLPGLLWLLGTLILFVHTALEVRSLLPRENLAYPLVEGSLAMTGYGLAHGLVDQSFLLPDLMLLFWLSVAFVASLQERLTVAP